MVFLVLLLFLVPFYLTFIAYSPLIVTPIFCAISDFDASSTYSLPCQLVDELLLLHIGHTSPS